MWNQEETTEDLTLGHKANLNVTVKKFSFQNLRYLICMLAGIRKVPCSWRIDTSLWRMLLSTNIFFKGEAFWHIWISDTGKGALLPSEKQLCGKKCQGCFADWRSVFSESGGRTGKHHQLNLRQQVSGTCTLHPFSLPEQSMGGNIQKVLCPWKHPCRMSASWNIIAFQGSRGIVRKLVPISLWDTSLWRQEFSTNSCFQKINAMSYLCGSD